MIPDIVGSAGALLMLVAYYLLDAGKLHPDKFYFPLLNLLGVSFMLYSLFFNWNTSAILMEIAWLLISLLGIVKAFRRHFKTTGSLFLDN